MTETTLPIRELFELEALTLTTAREKNKIIHQMKNIRSAGDEVEEAVRNFFSRRLAKRCLVGHGHIVDKHGLVSRDLDVIVADSMDFPSLQENRDGREYFPFESVYAIGEVKSTYDKSKEPIHKFVESIRFAKQSLKRDPAPHNFVGTGFGNGITLNGASNGPGRPYLNPLFTFMLFVNSGDFAKEDIEALFAETPREFLPNAVCLLDKGVLLYHKNLSSAPNHYHAVPIPEFENDTDCVWALAPLASSESLAMLWTMICDFLTGTTLLRPHYLDYAKRVFQPDDQPLQVLAGKKSEGCDNKLSQPV